MAGGDVLGLWPRMAAHPPVARRLALRLAERSPGRRPAVPPATACRSRASAPAVDPSRALAAPAASCRFRASGPAVDLSAALIAPAASCRFQASAPVAAQLGSAGCHWSSSRAPAVVPMVRVASGRCQKSVRTAPRAAPARDHRSEHRAPAFVPAAVVPVRSMASSRFQTSAPPAGRFEIRPPIARRRHWSARSSLGTIPWSSR